MKMSDSINSSREQSPIRHMADSIVTDRQTDVSNVSTRRYKTWSKAAVPRCSRANKVMDRR
jgi:hypothetical protein